MKAQEYRGWQFRKAKSGKWKITAPPGTTPFDIRMVHGMANGKIRNGGPGTIEEMMKHYIDGVENKNALKQEALDKGDYERYLRWCDSHHYLSAFLSILPRLTDKEYWTLLRAVWVQDDFQKLFQFDNVTDLAAHRENLKELVSSTRPCRECFVSAEDASALQKMPDTISIHRGYKFPSLADGFSWTTDVERAKWFAKRFDGNFVVSGNCRKGDVIGYFTDRNESEIVIHPKNVFNKSTKPLTA